MSGNSPPVYKSRAPAINPFDKLNQKQFDSYVSTIQAKIKVALDPPSPEPQHVSRTFAEISRSTIASPSLSPAPLSKRPGQNARPSSRATYIPLGAGTPNEPYELSDDDAETVEEAQSPRSRSQSEVPYEEEPESLGSIQEANEENEVESEGEQHGPNADLYGQEPDEGAWDYSGEDASEQDELSDVGETDENEEEEDVFVGKGKGRHPAEGPGLAGLLNGSSAHHTSIAPESLEQMSDSMSPDNSFEAGVSQMPTLGTTSTPFISRFATRRSARNMEEINDNEDDESPPWEGDQSSLIPMGADAHEGSSDEEGSLEKLGASGTGHDTAIEVLDSDDDSAPDRESIMEVDRPAARPSGSIVPVGLYAGLGGVAYPELDEPQFDDSAAFPHRTFEPDSLLDDTMDDHGSLMPGNILPKPSSLFTGSSADRTREPSQSRDVEESADTAHAQNYTVEGPDAGAQTPSVPGEEFEIDQRSIQHSMDYSDFIGEKSMLANQLDNSLTRTQVEENFLEVTVYELENGSRFYDHEGTRHFLNPEGEVYETCPIPPPRPTIQRPPDLSMIEEVTEYDMTRRMIGHDTYDEDQAPGRFDFLKGLDDSMSYVGAPISGHHPEDGASSTFDVEDIPQRPGAAMGFRARIVRGADGSAFLSESLVLGDSTNESLPTERANPLSRNHSLEESMTGRNAGDLISEVDDLISDDTFANADEDSIDSILDDDSRDESGMSALVNREDLTTPVPHQPTRVVENPTTDEGMDISGVQNLPGLDEKSVADALAAVAQFAQASSLEDMDIAGEVPETDVSMFANSEYDAFNQGTEGLEKLIGATTSMTSVEEDILARSFGVVDALQNTTGLAGGVDEAIETAVPEVHVSQETTVQSSVLDEIIQTSYADLPMDPEKLASEVLAEVFEGVDPVALPSGVASGTATPLEAPFLEPQSMAHIEEVEVDERGRERSPVPKPSDTEVQESPLRRTPPTPTLSVDQSITAPEMSIATSVSGLQPNISIYEGSPASSSHRDDITHSILPESDVTQLPDPTLPPAPTHLTTPIVSGEVPESAGAHHELSPSVMVEPPTPHTRSDVDTELGVQDASSEDATKTTANETEISGPVESVQNSDPEDAASVDALLSDGENTATDRSRDVGESSAETSGQGDSQATPTPTPEKRRMVFDGVELPIPRYSPQSSHNTPNRFMSESIISPVSDAAPPGYSPTPRKYQSLYKRTPKSVPFKTASETGSVRKSPGSDQGIPAPWPLGNLIHRHVRPEGSTTILPITRSSCRYHKISIPTGDGDHSAKVVFVVPACALPGQETMAEQGIEDHGLSTSEEEHKRITNLTKLESAVVGKLQVLVGDSLFSEGICGYLEEHSVSKAWRSSPRNKNLSASEGRSSAEPKGSGKEGRAQSSPRAKLKSRPRHDNRAYKPAADDSDSEDSLEDQPTRKRSKRRGTGDTASLVKFPTFGAESPQKPLEPLTTGPVTISKRMKRARRPAEARPFKPDPSDQDSSTDAESGRSPRKRTKRQKSSSLGKSNADTLGESSKQIPDEDTNPFKPTQELRRLLSPSPANQPESRPGISATLADSQLTSAEQKQLERHIALGDKPGEVVDESGDPVNTDNLEPAPAMAAAHVDRSAHNEVGQRESTSKEDSTPNPGTTRSWKSWQRFLRF
ncbi:unnamed protein product [Rhizoctonia solani]|uniref:Uncharacterized protein n=1 Tax=Rhizoctonia solani TaxID=456999 RepID=A0A8H3A6G1_9AGAM|nr:unnamed protein product [Rhizoctonia solani]